MTIEESAQTIRRMAADAGMTPAEWAHAFNNLSSEAIATSMEKLPTYALEWAVKFEAMEHKETKR